MAGLTGGSSTGATSTGASSTGTSSKGASSTGTYLSSFGIIFRSAIWMSSLVDGSIPVISCKQFALIA